MREVDSTVGYAYPQHWGDSEFRLTKLLRAQFDDIFFPAYILFLPVKYTPFLPVTEMNCPSYLSVSYLHLFSLFLSELLPTSIFLLDVKREYVSGEHFKEAEASANGGLKSPTLTTTFLVWGGFEILLFVFLGAMKTGY